MYLLVFVAIWLADINLLTQYLLTALVLILIGYDWQAKSAIRFKSQKLQYCPISGWRLLDQNQQLQAIQLGQCFISRPLLIINYRQAKKSRALVLLADSANGETLRKLRILLRQL